MNVASPKLAQELYDLTEWIDTTHIKDNGRLGFDYSLGYLLRKLPYQFDVDDDIFKLTLDRESLKTWRASYARDIANRKGRDLVRNWKFKLATADTPEDACAKLAIELFKSGVLPQGGDGAS